MTTVPERRSRMCGRTAFVTLSTPNRLVWNWVRAARELDDGDQYPACCAVRDAGSPSLLKDGLHAVAGVVDHDVYATPDCECLLDALLHHIGAV